MRGLPLSDSVRTEPASATQKAPPECAWGGARGTGAIGAKSAPGMVNPAGRGGFLAPTVLGALQLPPPPSQCRLRLNQSRQRGNASATANQATSNGLIRFKVFWLCVGVRVKRSKTFHTRLESARRRVAMPRRLMASADLGNAPAGLLIQI